MRNILEYPITADEVKDLLKRQITRLTSPEDPRDIVVGGVNVIIWQALLNTLEVQIDKDMTVMDLVLEEASVF